MLDAHPLAQQLRQQDSHTEKDRKVAKLTEDKVEHFTTGTLATRSAFAQPPAIMISDATQTVLALWHLGPGLSGHKGVVHGGATCTIMDECLGGAALYTGRQGGWDSGDAPSCSTDLF
jgi:acyl-coenzyme A thioesterase PaaI-like protein